MSSLHVPMRFCESINNLNQLCVQLSQELQLKETDAHQKVRDQLNQAINNLHRSLGDLEPEYIERTFDVISKLTAQTQKVKTPKDFEVIAQYVSAIQAIVLGPISSAKAPSQILGPSALSQPDQK
jgi:hypothetical protein